MKKIIICIFCAFSLFASAQIDSASNHIKYSGYLETYYQYDFAKPDNHTRPNFVYSFPRSNEVSLNLGLLKVAYEKENLRANLAFMTGSYSNTNLAAEPGVLKNLYEANIGIKILKKKNIWIDAGTFASHIGFESAIGKDCWNLTRSLPADNTPFYENGVKLSYISNNEKWLVSALFLNGWQRMQRVDANNQLAFGHQLTYKPNNKITLNSSSFIGSDLPDSIRLMRYFHNFYSQFQLTDKLGFIIGFDYGIQQKNKNSSDYNMWFSPIIQTKYIVNQKMSIAARVEYYSDKNQVMISTGTSNGFQTYGISINLDYNISENIIWRIEGRELISKDNIFVVNNKATQQNIFATTSLAISF